MKRSFKEFEARLNEIGLRTVVEKRALAKHVSLRQLFDGPDKATSVVAARKAVYGWLMKEGKSINEVARLFDRAPYGVWKMVGGNGQSK